jgi:hypothetical protein
MYSPLFLISGIISLKYLSKNTFAKVLVDNDNTLESINKQSFLILLRILNKAIYNLIINNGYVIHIQ